MIHIAGIHCLSALDPGKQGLKLAEFLQYLEGGVAFQKGDRTTAYNLDNLLDQQPGSEAQLIASGEVWQIAAFVALYTEKISKSMPSQRSGGEAEKKQTYRKKHF